MIMSTFISQIHLKFSSDFSLLYLRQMTGGSFFDLDNPILYSALLFIIVLAVIFIFFRYAIVPMRKHFTQEKKDMHQEHVNLMAALAEYDPDPVFRFSAAGKIIMINKAASELYSGNYLIGKNLFEIIPELVNVNFEELIREGDFITVTGNYRSKTYSFIVRGIPGLNIGQIYGSDITDLKNALNKAEESDLVKTNFLAQMSHEIRTPINAIMGFNSILKDNAEQFMNEEMVYSFNAIDTSCNRLTRTIDQLLNMSQLQSGSYKPETEKINLLEIIEPIISAHKGEAEARLLELRLKNELDDLTVERDLYSVTQILTSIIDNAVKYTRKGFIEIKLHRTVDKKPAISVEDTGIGITGEYLENIFSLFTQQQMGYNRKFEGNGLGLALSKKFADLNNIEITVTSRENEGSVFNVIFN